eukprot:m.87650 g.87650  ORF g.87650 m.87650 type:complete len:228 (-) comp13592_c1_seq1:28-711(-)
MAAEEPPPPYLPPSYDYSSQSQSCPPAYVDFEATSEADHVRLPLVSAAQDANTRKGFIITFCIGVMALSVVFLTHNLEVIAYAFLGLGGAMVLALLVLLPRRFELHEDHLVIAATFRRRVPLAYITSVTPTTSAPGSFVGCFSSSCDWLRIDRSNGKHFFINPREPTLFSACLRRRLPLTAPPIDDTDLILTSNSNTDGNTIDLPLPLIAEREENDTSDEELLASSS